MLYMVMMFHMTTVVNVDRNIGPLCKTLMIITIVYNDHKDCYNDYNDCVQWRSPCASVNHCFGPYISSNRWACFGPTGSLITDH